jgi:hypothetical protein
MFKRKESRQKPDGFWFCSNATGKIVSFDTLIQAEQAAQLEPGMMLIIHLKNGGTKRVKTSGELIKIQK